MPEVTSRHRPSRTIRERRPLLVMRSDGDTALCPFVDPDMSSTPTCNAPRKRFAMSSSRLLRIGLSGASSQDPRLGVPRESIYDWACEPTLFEDLAAHPVRSTAPFCAHRPRRPFDSLLIGHSNRKNPPALYSRPFSGNFLEAATAATGLTSSANSIFAIAGRKRLHALG